MGCVGILAACGDDGSALEDGGSDTGAGAGSAGSGAGSAGSGAGSAGSGASGAGAGPGGGCALEEETHSGEGTYYAADGSGNCSFPPSPGDLLVAAMNQTDYAGSAACGACIEVEGPVGTVTVRIVDRCPECLPGDVDMSPEAFAHVAAMESGRVPITWRYVGCGLSGSVVYHFKDSSNPWWMQVQVRNHRYPIAEFAVRTEDGQYVALARENHNYFTGEGLGEGPFTFRVTDTLGNVIEDAGIPLLDNAEAPGAAQFPACSAM
ncbi:Rare lipoprotein A [Chondromyces apiculatus DSM 436]|uniref:Rare lipoprotein A n=1 Tax=Chondromyces apiculatus DSM 436 TaxID=1192034 RepID=A0A017SU80_9BACT|nr:Rare lipoprotein A [Chondromyces apiculatus DSM 436]